MTLHTPENNEREQQPLTGEAVIAQFRTSYDAIWDIIKASEGLDGPKQQSAAALSDLVGKFVAKNLSEGKGIIDLPKPDDLEGASRLWIEAKLSRKLLDEAIVQIQEREVETLTKMLEGKTLTAHNIGDFSFGISQTGYMYMHYQDNPKTVTGRFVSVDPASAALLLKGDEYYSISVLTAADANVVAVELEVND